MPLGGGLTLTALGVSAVGAGFKYFNSKADKAKAEQEEAGLHTPFFKVQNEYFQNRDLAGVNAEFGTPASTRNYQTTENQRGLTAGIGGILESGGDPNQVGKLLDVYQDNIRRTAADDAKDHITNLNTFLERNAAVAGQKNIAYSINELQPYERKLKQLQARKKADVENQYGAVSDFAGSLAGAGVAVSNMNNGEPPSKQPFSQTRNLGQQQIEETGINPPQYAATPQQYMGNNSVFNSVMNDYNQSQQYDQTIGQN